jgi:hypothetical protein
MDELIKASKAYFTAEKADAEVKGEQNLCPLPLLLVILLFLYNFNKILLTIK